MPYAKMDRRPTPPHVKREDALVDFIAMPARSLRALHKHYAEREDVRTPSYELLRKWSSQENWAERAAEHDARAAEQAAQALGGMASDRMEEIAKRLMAVGERALSKAEAAMGQVQVHRPGELHSLVSVAITCIAESTKIHRNDTGLGEPASLDQAEAATDRVMAELQAIRAKSKAGGA